MNNQEKGVLGESFVYELTQKAFFSYWCFVNPKDDLGDKKEICDILVNFKGILLLICVKNYEFKGIYSRYFRKCIEKDVRQLNGAQRKILNSKYDIQIQNENGRIHILDKKEIKTVHRIIVHLGDKVHFYPFNKITKTENFVHVFDKNSFYNLINYLDTIVDFEEFLRKRELAFSNKEVFILPNEENSFDNKTREQFLELESNKSWGEKTNIIISGTECDLLAHYIEHNRTYPKQITENEYNGMLIQIDGEWDNFISKEKSKIKKENDRVSYLIDDYINGNVMKNPNKDNLELAKSLLSFNRFERRIFTKHLYDLVKKNSRIQHEDFIERKMGELNGIGIIFVFYTVNASQEFINNILPLILDSYCVYSKYKYQKIILAASTNNGRQFKFAVKNNITPFDVEYENLIKKEIKKQNWFKNINETKFSEFEFPNN